jgi:hypothetical protein
MNTRRIVIAIGDHVLAGMSARYKVKEEEPGLFERYFRIIERLVGRDCGSSLPDFVLARHRE